MPILHPGDLGPVCPDCGTPLRSASHGCSHCGFSPRSPRRLQGGVLTPFGYGVCGFGTGVLANLVANLTNQPAGAGSSPLVGLLICLACASLAARVGKSLAPELRGTYEHLLVSLVVGGLVTLVVAVSCPLTPDPGAVVWLGSAAVTYGLMRRYGYRDSGLGTG